MDPSVAALQNAVNRFAAVGGFARVAVDGLWGSKTRAGTLAALSWIGQGKCYRTACADIEASNTAGGLYVQWDETQASAKGIAEFLAGVANDLEIPHVAAPMPSTSTGPIVAPPTFKIGLVERFKMLPLWQQISAGVIAGLGLIFVVNRFSAKPRKKAA